MADDTTDSMQDDNTGANDTNPLAGQPVPPTPSGGGQFGGDEGADTGVDSTGGGSMGEGTAGVFGGDSAGTTGEESADQAGQTGSEDSDDTDPNNLPGTSGQGVL